MPTKVNNRVKVPFDDWSAGWTGNGGDPDERTSYATFWVDAFTPIQAEERVLTWAAFHYDDDMRNAVATATDQVRVDQFNVRIDYH